MKIDNQFPELLSYVKGWEKMTNSEIADAINNMGFSETTYNPGKVSFYLTLCGISRAKRKMELDCAIVEGIEGYYVMPRSQLLKRLEGTLSAEGIPFTSRRVQLVLGQVKPPTIVEEPVVECWPPLDIAKLRRDIAKNPKWQDMEIGEVVSEMYTIYKDPRLDPYLVNLLLKVNEGQDHISYFQREGRKKLNCEIVKSVVGWKEMSPERIYLTLDGLSNAEGKMFTLNQIFQITFHLKGTSKLLISQEDRVKEIPNYEVIKNSVIARELNKKGYKTERNKLYTGITIAKIKQKIRKNQIISQLDTTK